LTLSAGCAAQCVAMTLRAAAHSGAWSPELTTALTDRFLALCTPPTPSASPAAPPAAAPDGLATVVWALATLPQSDDATTGVTVRALRRLVETHLEQFDVKELAQLVWALAVLDQLDMDLLQAMTARVQVTPQRESSTARGSSSPSRASRRPSAASVSLSHRVKRARGPQRRSYPLLNDNTSPVESRAVCRRADQCSGTPAAAAKAAATRLPLQRLSARN
jgi:hypothetical protein